jgi:RNA polymerase sigma factor (TIGR02999 family)
MTNRRGTCWQSGSPRNFGFLAAVYGGVSDVTRILQALPEEGARAAEELLPLVYAELRQLATGALKRESKAFTLQPTALVHEAWLRLIHAHPGRFQNRQHFFSVAAQAMRRVLVDAARRKQTAKRGAAAEQVELQEGDLILAAPADEILAVDEAVELLGRQDPQAAELVKLRYFVGLSMEECAVALGQSVRSAERLWTYAKAWLRRHLQAERRHPGARNGHAPGPAPESPPSPSATGGLP